MSDRSIYPEGQVISEQGNNNNDFSSFSTKRRHERYQCEMAVWLRPDTEDSEYQLAEVLNIGGGGIFCLIHIGGFQHGDLLDLCIDLPQRGEMVKIKGEVRHSRPAPDECEYLGVQFTRVEGMTVPALMAYIEAMFN